jgi:hypothetical protein
MMIGVRCTLAAGALLAACSGQAPLVLPGKLDMPVAAGHNWKFCPDDGAVDTTPDADCILGRGADVSGPYEKWLTANGWQPESEGDQQLLLWWKSPAKPDGKRTCLFLTPHETNAARGEGVLLQFTVRDLSDPDAPCRP